MTLLPIQFWSKYEKKDYENLSSEGVLDLVEGYLEEKGFNYIKRTENKVIFHSVFDGWGIFDVRSRLVSGIVKIKDDNKRVKIVNGNWLCLLIALPFLVFVFLAGSSFSTLDKDDLDLIWLVFGILFIGNLIVRIVAHAALRGQIQELIIKNYAQQRL